MQLTFLGVRYEAKLFSIPVAKSQMRGKYRGQFFWFKTKFGKEISIRESFCRLKYRGVEYLGTTYSHTNSQTGEAQLGLEEFKNGKGFLELDEKKSKLI